MLLSGRIIMITIFIDRVDNNKCIMITMSTEIFHYLENRWQQLHGKIRGAIPAHPQKTVQFTAIRSIIRTIIRPKPPAPSGHESSCLLHYRPHSTDVVYRRCINEMFCLSLCARWLCTNKRYREPASSVSFTMLPACYC